MIQRDPDADRRLIPFDEYRRPRIITQEAPAPKDPSEMHAVHAFDPEYYDDVQKKREAEREAAAQAAAQPVEDELTDHNYDGIQEYDNPTPGWWYMIFWGSVVFSVLYVFVYHLSTAVPTLPERHAYAEARALEERFAELNEFELGEFKILKIMNEPAWLEQGASVYSGACAICHGTEGQGLIGPNLTDETYKNIAGLMDIPNLVITGTENGAMPSQRNQLNDNEIALVAAYVASLRGRGLPTPGTVDPALIGEPIAPWPELTEDGQIAPATTGQQVSTID
ncbi:MAG: cbb3-type cytochrome c oxidase N-terminal domain-containing protein [Planctomycetota bacterium]